MFQRAPWLWLLLCAISLRAQTFDPPNIRRGFVGPRLTFKSFLSPNGQFRLTLEDAAVPVNSKQKLAATISKLENNVPVIRWTTEFESRSIMWITERDLILSDDGRYFLLSENYGRDWNLYREGKRPQSLLTSRDIFNSRGPMSAVEKIVELDELNNEPIVRLWNSRWDAWDAYYIHRDDKIKVTDEMSARWNDATRQKVLDHLSRARLDLMRQKVGAISQKLGDIAGNALSSLKAPDIHEVHFEFLALRRRPEDRIWFERLLNETDPKATQQNPNAGFMTFRTINGRLQTFPAVTEYYHYEKTSYARTRGDWLLANFDKKDLRGISENDRPLFYLGSISGTIRLPAPILRRAGKIRIYLAPETRAKKDFSTNDVETIEATLDNQLPAFDFADEVTFKFGTVSTGKYSLKVIWDKRPAFNDATKPGPGDYESAWTAPIEVTPGASIANVTIKCDVPAADGAAYYAADEMAHRKWAETGELSRLNFHPDPEGRREVFGAIIDRWIVQTNFEKQSVFHGMKRISLMTRVPGPNTNDLLRPPELLILARRSSVLLSSQIRLRILDEHGCIFLPTITRSFSQITLATFPSYPRNSKTFRLVGFGSGKDIIFDYTLTNLYQNPPPTVTPARPLPIQIALSNVTMTVQKIVGDSRSPQIEATFTENGQWTNGWWASEILFGDADGNIIDPEDACREQTITRVLGRISRNTPGSRETRPFQFTIDRRKPWVDKE